MTEEFTVVAVPSGKRARVPKGTGLREAIRQAGIEIESICAENATCGKCKVLVEEGSFGEYDIVSSRAHLSPPGAEETDYFTHRSTQLANRGWTLGQVRLSCQAKVLGDVLVTVPVESLVHRLIVRKSVTEHQIQIDPSIRKYLVELNPPTLGNPKADWERLASGIATSMRLVRGGQSDLPQAVDLSIDYQCLRSLSEKLRQSAWRVTVSIWQDREVVRVEPGYNENLYGTAIDIGTTTLALYLCNLMSGEVVATESDINPQIKYGEDVMSRIQFANSNPEGLDQLHKSILRSLNQMLLRAAKTAGIDLEEILEIVVVGNTTMQHLFLNLPPKHLGVAPFTPSVSRAWDIKARELRLAINKSANVHMLPAIASFIGADTTAVLLAEEPHTQDEICLLIDIGTNAELIIGNRKRLICASTPTGPAFEGAHIEYGMRAAPGAIEHLRIDSATMQSHWKLIGEEQWDAGAPIGLCGTAVIDTVAGLLAVGGLDLKGKFIPTNTTDRIRLSQNGYEYVIAYAKDTGIDIDICLTQKDVRQIQLAKGALYVAAQALMDYFGILVPDKILLAGSFGSYIDKTNAMKIGMLPRIDLDRVSVVGNAAGEGALIALLNVAKRREAMQIAQQIKRHELPTDPVFQMRFLEAMNFPAVVKNSGGYS
jgi:uncharacterized 2Fe-2S/4Fe-4S cluster protein (DUF4445 family)